MTLTGILAPPGAICAQMIDPKQVHQQEVVVPVGHHQHQLVEAEEVAEVADVGGEIQVVEVFLGVDKSVLLACAIYSLTSTSV